MTPERIRDAEILIGELTLLTKDFEAERTDRVRVAAALFIIAQDHHQAIVFLIKNQFYSSGFALLRPCFESYARGVWARYIATDLEITAFMQGDDKPAKCMWKKIKQHAPFANGRLSRVKEKAYSTMCDYTHTGGLHCHLWQSKAGVEASFPPELLEEMVNAAELFGCIAALEMVRLATNGDNGVNVLHLMTKRWPLSSSANQS